MKRTKIFCIYYRTDTNIKHFICEVEFYFWEDWRSKLNKEIFRTIDELKKEKIAITNIQII